MKEKTLRAEQTRNNIIPIHLDATFFFERAVRSLDRNHYDKALKYFRKAVEYEPENAVNHCNLAGVLSEMGDFEGSNRVLKSILDDVDPTMTECYFYMANNFANMEQFEAAEEALITYLEEDPYGQFLDEAEEMMELLRFELHRPTKVSKIKAREGMVEHDRARALLEEGKFAQAVELLEEILEEHPDFLAARNNLALAYYYMGFFDEAKDEIVKVLDEEPGNLHALCNLTILYQHEGNRKAVDELLSTLRPVVPFHQEHVFKLATTMGILGEHEAAYGHFCRLLKDDEVNFDPCLFHYAAVAAWNTGRYNNARRHWIQADKLDPESGIARFYLSQYDSWADGTLQPQPISYHYHLPFEEQFKLWQKNGGTIPESVKADPLVRSSFFWALRHGNYDTKLQVIEALGQVGDYEVQQALRAFLVEPDEEESLKDVALFVLRHLGVKGPLPLKQGGSTTFVNPEIVTSELPEWNNDWQRVVSTAFKQMKSRYDVMQQYDLENLWVEYLTKVYPDVPVIFHVEGWAAALEYLTAKMHRHPLTYQEVAERYGISVSTVSKYARQIDQVCGIKDKIKAIFPSNTGNI